MHALRNKLPPALVAVAGTTVAVVERRRAARARAEAHAAGRRGQMLEELGAVVRGLYSSADVRADVCEAARTIGQGIVALLYEPVLGAERLRTTAIAGFTAPHAEVPLRSHSALIQAYRTGRATLLTENVAERVGSKEHWRASGSPESVLYEPVLQGGTPVGVLVVGWRGQVRHDGPQVTVVELLAHEIANVIARGDALAELADIASTDSLTGLPNRRTWDSQLVQASRGRQKFTIAILDLDHFKEYNDSRGHASGDRLFKETASTWREEIRAGDLLARIGGEEFGLLLPGCGAERAAEVVERLRLAVVGESTCSAGFAERRVGESSISVMARADEALYRAKAEGRDRTCTAG